MVERTFPDCCGIRLFTGFGNTQIAIDKTEYSVGDVASFLDSNSYSYGRALNMVVLNNDQRQLFNHVLVSRGYVCTNDKGYYHPNHNTYIYVYIKDNNI